MHDGFIYSALPPPPNRLGFCCFCLGLGGCCCILRFGRLMLPPGAVVADAAALLAAPLPLSLPLLLRLASLVAFLCARPRGLDAERLGDGVPALRHDDIRESKAQADSCGLRSTRAASESDSCHSRIRPDEFWVSKSPRSAIPDVSVSHHVTQTPLRFSRGTTSANARQPTRRGSALGRSALSDFKATHQEILGSNNLQGKRRTISTSLVSENPRAKCAAVT